MEMLIVVAIIAILVAIAFPIFNKKLNDARVATDAANIRTGYAAINSRLIEHPGEFPGDVIAGLNGSPGNTLHKDGTVGGQYDNSYRTQGDATSEDYKDIVDSLKSCGVKKGWEKNRRVAYMWDGDKNKVFVVFPTK